MEQFLAEAKGIKKVIPAVNLNTGVNTGGRISMKGNRRVSFIVDLGAAATATSHVFILKQHDAASSGNTYDLASANPIYHKVDDATVFTKIELDTAVATNDLHTVLGDDTALVVFEVLAENLRSDCAWVSLVINQPGVTQLGSAIGIVEPGLKPAYAQAF